MSDQDTTQLIVGLGNPGERYVNTRHNIGFMVLDTLAEDLGISFKKTRFGLVAKGNGFWLLKPLTFMNLSGQAVGPMLRWHRIAPAELLVVGDDLDLPLGRLRLRRGGSSGGHNGLKSIIETIGTDQFSRLRLGIDRPPAEIPVIDWVLMSFRRTEQDLLERVIGRATQAVHAVLADGVAMAMNRFNGDPGD